MFNTTVFDCSIIELPKIYDPAGNITVVEDGQFPFPLKAIFYLYDVPGGVERGGHAHYEMKHFMVAASGSFEVILDDGVFKRNVALNRPNFGIFIPSGIWVKLFNFSSGAISLNLVSNEYDEKDYIRDYNVFLKYKNKSD